MSEHLQFERGVLGTLVMAKKDKVVGEIALKFYMKGNQEPLELEFVDVTKECCDKLGFIYKDLNVYKDDAFSTIMIKVYDKETILEYISKLEKLSKEL